MLTRASLLDRYEKDFAPFANATGILVAVSGGPDSMALLRLAAHWASTPGRPPVLAATVDHGLRAESRAEADEVARWCAPLGLRHQILTWTGPKPATRIQERAREVRYRLLDACARQHGCDVLLTAHHMDDQAETVLFRLARGSGIAGLAAMAIETPRGDIRHGRPLLLWRKDELVSLCVQLGQPFATDPSNADPRYARVRLRRLAKDLAAEGLDAEGLVRLAARARRAERALEQTAAAAQARLARIAEVGEIALDCDALLAEPAEIALRVVRSCMARVAPLGAPRLEKLERLMDDLSAAHAAAAPFGQTLGGALLRWKPGRALVIRPESARRTGAMVNGLST